MAEPDAPMRRVLVVGSPGAGKSRLSRLLAKHLALPLIHLDFHYWRSGWIEPEPAVWRSRVAELAGADEWIMDGNYSGTFDLRVPRADTLVWVDVPRTVCLRRVIWRSIRNYGTNRPDLPDGCPEQFSVPFFRYVWNFPAKSQPHILAGIDRFGRHLRVVQLRSNHDIDRFVRTVGAA